MNFRKTEAFKKVLEIERKCTNAFDMLESMESKGELWRRERQVLNNIEKIGMREDVPVWYETFDMRGGGEYCQLTFRNWVPSITN